MSDEVIILFVYSNGTSKLITLSVIGVVERALDSD